MDIVLLHVYRFFKIHADLFEMYAVSTETPTYAFVGDRNNWPHNTVNYMEYNYRSSPRDAVTGSLIPFKWGNVIFNVKAAKRGQTTGSPDFPSATILEITTMNPLTDGSTGIIKLNSSGSNAPTLKEYTFTSLDDITSVLESVFNTGTIGNMYSGIFSETDDFLKHNINIMLCDDAIRKNIAWLNQHGKMEAYKKHVIEIIDGIAANEMLNFLEREVHY